MNNNFDAIIIGGGAMGLASAYQMGKRKVSVLVLEKFKFLNQLGSSAGYSRQYRIPYPEDYMVQMALDTQPYWDELQQYTRDTLMTKVGTLWFGDPNVHSTEGNIAGAEKAMSRLGVKYDSLSVENIEEEFHFRNLPENYTGLFQADGASIDLAATLQTLYDLNLQNSVVTLKDHCPVTQIERKGDIFYISTPEGTFTSPKLVITPGPYINEVLELLDFKVAVTYWEMSSAYFKKTQPDIQYPTWFVFQEPVGENGNQFYGFPGVEWDYPGYIRVAPDFVVKPLTSPNQRTGQPNARELLYTSEWIKNHMTGLDPRPEKTSTCLIALSKLKNKEMLLDFAPPYVPGHPDIVIYATGWAAKFIPLLGKILADLAIDGHTSYDIAPFRLGAQYFTSLK
ncbi:MAG TPA: FAD-dependent oxidoreductase [Membranihabitans sp.]|nr:FAD-dependent oxidoreductase [Membranihabitans sp.]